MEETDKQLAEILKKGIDAAERTGNFILDQAPDLIQQLIVWKTAMYSFNTLLSILMVYGCYRWYKAVAKKIKIHNEGKSNRWQECFEDYPSLTIGGSTITIIAVSIFFMSTHNLLQILLAPKVWLIEYAASLLR